MNQVPGHIALHVSGLPKNMDEASLVELIQKKFGKDFAIDSVKVCRDWNTNKSRGSGYINCSLENAQKIIAAMNHNVIGDSEMNICVKYHKGEILEDANIFVGNLNTEIQYSTFEKEFAAFGEFVSTKLRTLPNKKIGYIQYKNLESAKKAISSMDGANFGGKSIQVTVFLPYEKRANQTFTGIHVANFLKLSKDELKNIFSRFGELQSEPFIFDKPKEHDNVITYAASITFKDHASAAKAIDELNGKKLNNQETIVSVERFRNKVQRKQDSKNVVHKPELNLYLSGLAESTTIEQLRSTMIQFGDIDSVRIMFDEQGKSRLYGYCSYKDSESVNKAKNANGIFVNGSPLMIKQFLLKAQRTSRRPNALSKVKSNIHPSYPRRNYNNNNKHSKQSKAAHHAPAPVQAAPAPVPAAAKQNLIEPIPKNEFDGMSDEDRHETFGEKIYEYVQTYLPNENPGKITGMILESFKNNYSALNSVIANGKIVEKINEAITVLKKHTN